MKHVISFIAAIALGVLLVFAYSNLAAPKVQSKQALSAPQISTQFSLEKAPKQSLQGQIASLSGVVLWQSRTATEGAKLLSPRILQQGENLETKDNGSVTFTFPHLGTISLQPKTKLEIIQTLPVNPVFTQDNGTATYNKSGDLPLSIKSLHLLIMPKTGMLTVTTSEKLKTVRVSLANGSAEAAYEDTDNNTQTVMLKSDETLVYADDSREVSKR